MFSKPKDDSPTRHLIVANCGPGAGMSLACTQALLRGAAEVRVADNNKPHVFASFADETAATQTRNELTSEECFATFGRRFVVKYAELNADPHIRTQLVHLNTDSCPVPGLALYSNFITLKEEEDLLADVENGAWESLAHRRVQHYGYRFEYQTRNVDKSKPVGSLPPATEPILQRLREVPGMPAVDQLTVNEYPPGVGLSPHIDTHSAFTGAIASLSLGGACVMELRRGEEAHAFYLTARSLLVMADYFLTAAGAARYQWQHYIPHRKFDYVNGMRLPRSKRRVSFTFRQVRGFACTCDFPEHCDSQAGALPPTRLLLRAEKYDNAVGPELVGTQHTATEGACILTAPCENGAGEANADAALHADAQHKHSIEQLPDAYDSNGGLETIPARPSSDSSCRDARDHGQESECARRGDEAGDPSARAAAEDLENRHVHAVYDVIASHFSATRYAVWPKVGAFLHALSASSLLADIGCGNGKYFSVRPDLVILGSDRSFGLVEQAMLCTRLPTAGQTTAVGRAGKNGCLDARGGSRSTVTHAVARGVAAAPRAEVIVADALRLPYRDGLCDAAICIAVLHHISSEARRQALLQEILRILRRGGQALVTVWASEQEDAKKLAKWEPIAARAPTSRRGADPTDSEPATVPELRPGDYFVPWHLPFHRADAAAVVEGVGAAEGAESAERPELGTINEEKSSVVFKRFYHLFVQGELEDLVGRISGSAVTASFYDKSNWCIIMQKT